MVLALLWVEGYHRFFFLYGRPFMLWGTVLWTWLLLADQRGIEPPPTICQRRQKRRPTSWATRTTDWETPSHSPFLDLDHIITSDVSISLPTTVVNFSPLIWMPAERDMRGVEFHSLQTHLRLALSMTTIISLAVCLWQTTLELCLSLLHPMRWTTAGGIKLCRHWAGKLLLHLGVKTCNNILQFAPLCYQHAGDAK